MSQEDRWWAEERFDVAIVGAGAIGATAAYELTRRGARVVIVERSGDWAAGCSRSNAGWICPSHAGHYASRRDLAMAVRWVLRSDTPFGFKPRPALVPFGARLVASTRAKAIDSSRELLQSLAIRSLETHAALAAGGLDTGYRQEGLLDVYRTSGALAGGERAAAIQRRAGLEPHVVSAAEVIDLEPALSRPLAGAILYPHEAHCDPLRYVRAVGRAAEEGGARLLAQTEVFGADRGAALATTAGPVRADAVIISAGVYSAPLTRAWKRRVPLEAGKGYTIDLETGAPLLRRPLMLQEDRVAVTPLDGRLRLAGTMQFAGLDERIDMRRVHAIRAAAARSLPATRTGRELDVAPGLRPCTPDGLPLVGWLGGSTRTAVVAGHAMLGLTLAPVTGELVADLMEGRAGPELERLDPGRFAANR